MWRDWLWYVMACINVWRSNVDIGISNNNNIDICIYIYIYIYIYLLHRLSSYFGLSSLSLQWSTSYSLSRTSAVSIPPYLSPSSSLTCGVPQDSVLGPILFNLYTTPLSTLISSSIISHLLYADDTQLFVSFTPKNFPLVISDLQSTIWLILSWMSSNCLTLNPFKTEFLLNGFLQNTSNIINPLLSLPNAQPISPTPFAKNLGFIFDSTLSFSKQISSLSNACH